MYGFVTNATNYLFPLLMLFEYEKNITKIPSSKANSKTLKSIKMTNANAINEWNK